MSAVKDSVIMEKYQNWINKNYPTHREALGYCKEACQAMMKEFPELRVTNGFVTVLGMPEPRAHWWCVTEDGEIVDPTKHQYSGMGYMLMDYEEIDDEHDARKYPQARCMECGDYYYVTPELGRTMHTKACESAFINSLNEQRYENFS